MFKHHPIGILGLGNTLSSASAATEKSRRPGLAV